jgi:hypothetical protein
LYSDLNLDLELPPMADNAFHVAIAQPIVSKALMCEPMHKKEKTLCDLVVLAAVYVRQFVRGAY